MIVWLKDELKREDEVQGRMAAREGIWNEEGRNEFRRKVGKLGGEEGDIHEEIEKVTKENQKGNRGEWSRRKEKKEKSENRRKWGDWNVGRKRESWEDEEEEKGMATDIETVGRNVRVWIKYKWAFCYKNFISQK